MKKILIPFFSLFLSGSVLAGATFSRVKTWSSGETLTASDLNGELNNILTNLTPAGIDDYSANTTEMRTVTDPYPASAESLATSLQGEIERLRYQTLQLKRSMQASGSNDSYWYQDTPTQGVFTVAGSSVGVNDTTPDYVLDVAGTLGVDGVVTVSTITSTLSAISIATHTTITGNLSVSGTFSPQTLTVSGGSIVFSSASFVSAIGNGPVALAVGSTAPLEFDNTELVDRLSEFNGSTFTAQLDGYYEFSVTASFTGSSAASGETVNLDIMKNTTEMEDLDGDIPSDTSYSAACPMNFGLLLTAGQSVWIRAHGPVFAGTVTFGQNAIVVKRVP